MFSHIIALNCKNEKKEIKNQVIEVNNIELAENNFGHWK